LTAEWTPSKGTGSISCEVEFCIFYRLSQNFTDKGRIYKSYDKYLFLCFQICKGGVDKSPGFSQFFYHKTVRFYGIRSFITSITKVCNWTLILATLIRSTSLHPNASHARITFTSVRKLALTAKWSPYEQTSFCDQMDSKYRQKYETKTNYISRKKDGIQLCLKNH
jgi:hypothetical protein